MNEETKSFRTLRDIKYTLYHTSHGEIIIGTNPRLKIYGDMILKQHQTECRGVFLYGDCSRIYGKYNEIIGLYGDCSNITGNISNISGDVSNISGDVSNITGTVTLELKGNVTFLKGNISRLSGNCTNLVGEIPKIKLEYEGYYFPIESITKKFNHDFHTLESIKKDVVLKEIQEIGDLQYKELERHREMRGGY